MKKRPLLFFQKTDSNKKINNLVPKMLTIPRWKGSQERMTLVALNVKFRSNRDHNREKLQSWSMKMNTISWNVRGINK